MNTISVFRKLQRRLIREEGLPLAYTAILAAQALNQFRPEARDAAKRWAEGESIAGFALADTSVRELQDAVGGSEFQALCMLNALADNFNAFAEATLVAGIDSVTPPAGWADGGAPSGR